MRVALSCLFLAAFLAASASAPGAHGRTTAVTWAGDVRPVLAAHCFGCHAQAGASFSLESYETARGLAASIAREARERRMPPWPASRGFGDFTNDRSLTPNEIELLSAWADGGMPRGDEAEARSGPAGPVERPRWPRDRTRVLEVPDGGATEGTRTVDVAVGNLAEEWIAAWQFRPSSIAAIEQADLSIAGGERIGTWVPPENATELPSGVAQRLPAASRLRVRLAYRKAASRPPTPAASSVVLYLAAGRPNRILRHRWVPCGVSRVPRGAELLAIRPFSVRGGVPLEALVRRPDERVEPLCWIHEYRLRYEPAYRFRQPVALPAGSEIAVHSAEAGCGADLEVVSARAKPTR